MTAIPSSRAIRWGWAVLMVAALASRLLGLSTNLLAPGEAARALASLDAVQGYGWQAAAESPLLLVGNAMLFAIFGAGDGVARLLPAFAGVGVVALPWLWRKRLGEVGALSAGVLLLLSPLVLFAARRVDGAALGTLGAGLLISLLLREVGSTSAEDRWVPGLFAAGVTVGLLAGPAFYDLLLSGLLAWVILRRSQPGQPAKLPLSPMWVGVGVGVGAAILITTAFGLRWSGWAGIADGAAAWIAGWRASPGSSTTPIGLLALYEPLLIMLAISGIVLLFQRFEGPRTPQWAIALWGLLAVVINSLRPGSTPESSSATLLPVALLGGYAFQTIVMGVRSESLRWVGLHTLVSFFFWLPGLLALVQYAGGFAHVDQFALVLLGAGVLVALQVLLVFLCMLVLPPNKIWRSSLLGVAAVALVLQISFAAGLAYVRPSSPIEPAVMTSTSPDIRHLRTRLFDIAVLRGLRSDALPVVILDSDTAVTNLLRWNLRQYARMMVSSAWPEDAHAIVIGPEGAQAMEPQAPETWKGMAFAVTSTYDGPLPHCEQLVPPMCSDALHWYLYRTSPHPPSSGSVILWQTADDIIW